MNVLRTAIALAGVAGLAGCGGILGPGDCTDEARPGITVDLRDADTNGPLTVAARVIARDGAYADTIETEPSLAWVGLAHEREGSYTVTVDAAGYSPWSRSGIPVIDGGCHVRTIKLTARLER